MSRTKGIADSGLVISTAKTFGVSACGNIANALHISWLVPKPDVEVTTLAVPSFNHLVGKEASIYDD